MARRTFVVRHGRIINRAHLDQDYPYRYEDDPIRVEAHLKATRSAKQAHVDILTGLADYYASK